MKSIVSLTLHRESIPLKNPFTTALRSVDAVEFIRVCIVLEGDAKLYGEAPATKAVTGEDLDSIEHNIQEIVPKILGKTPKEALNIIHDAPIGNSAKASIDMALFELSPVTDTQPIKCDITISLQESTKMLESAKRAWANGVQQLKVKFGEDIQHAIDTTHLLLQHLPDAELLVDANQAWNLQTTLAYINELKRYPNVKLIEQPVKADELEVLKTITTNSSIPILADESAFTLQEVQTIVENNIADMINIKLMKCGGVSEAVKILEYVRKQGVQCMLGSMLEGPISINAALDLAFLYRDVIKYVDLDSPLLYKEANHPLLRYRFEGSTVFSQ